MNTFFPFAAKARLPLASVALAAAMFGAPAHAAGLSFVFDYASAATSAEQAAITSAGTLFSQMFGTHFSNTATIELDVNIFRNLATPVLMSAGSYQDVPVPGFGGAEMVRQSVLAGSSASGATGVLNINFAYDWELNPNTPASSTSYDFFASFDHEITHALGFSSNLPGDSINTSWTKFDQFLQNGSSAALIDHTTLLKDDSAIAAAATNGIFFTGANAVAANGGTAVKIDSNFSHLDSDSFPADMMRPGRGFGPDARDFSAVDVGILTDLGYTAVTASVPEPTTYALMMAGLGLVGFAAKRRKS